jgi:hypothetical protein
MDLAHKLKMALDECRLLILGAQVLFGCQFQMVFQEAFQDAPRSSQIVQGLGRLALLLAVGLLIASSMAHQIAYRGEDRNGALSVATICAGLAMLPMTAGLGATTFVVFERLFDRNIGIFSGVMFGLVAFSFLYGLGHVLKTPEDAHMPSAERVTPLKDKIEELLTEARVIIPGAQALLGFQFVVVFESSFGELPGWVKATHAFGLGAVALSVVLLMTPAALHRIAYAGESNPTFFRVGSALVIGAGVPLALGIASDIGVVGFKITGDTWLAAGIGGLSLLVLMSFWFFYPLWRRVAAASVA